MSYSAKSRRRGRRTFVFEPLEDRQLLAVDLEPLAISSIGLGAHPQQLTAVDDQLYFVATHGRTQAGLWVTDGTNEGTRQVLPDESLPLLPRFRSLTGMGGQLFYVLDDRQLWVSNGTAAGTTQLATFFRIGAQEPTRDFLATGDRVYFIAEHEIGNGSQIWQSDGTPAGTVLAAELPVGETGRELGNLTNVNGTIYFTSMDPSGRFDLWRIADTSVDVTPIMAFAPGQVPGHLYGVGETLYFSVTEQTGEGSLWKSDGSKRGAEVVFPVRLMQEEATPSGERLRFDLNITEVNGLLYFAGTDGDAGYELWQSDGTEVGTVTVQDIQTGPASARPTELTNVAGTLYFTADDGVNGRQLWKSDGTAVGTIRLEPSDAVTGAGPQFLHNANGALYFLAASDGTGVELWSSDGTDEGTGLVKDVQSGPLAGARGGLASIGDAVYFAGNDGTHGEELWRSNGTADGTSLVKDLVIGTVGSNAVQMANVNGKIYFGADDGEHGHELWSSDGTAAGTQMIKDIHPVPLGQSVPTNFTNVSGTLYFSATDQLSAGLWQSDGTEGGTQLVRHFTGKIASQLGNFVNLGGVLYFTVQPSVTGYELWRSDGTEAGTVLISDQFNVGSIAKADQTVYLSIFQPNVGWELGKLEPSATEPVLVKDILPGKLSSSPHELKNIGGKIYFVATDSVSGEELWTTDGTEVGTVLVKDTLPGTQAGRPRLLTNVGGILYFVATTLTESAAEHFETDVIWRSDGTTDGTVPVILVDNDEPVELTVRSMANVDGVLHYATTHVSPDSADSEFELQIWRSTGDAKIPVRLKAFPQMATEWTPNIFENIAGLLYFTAPDESGTIRLWRSDGTNEGTRPLDESGDVPALPFAVVPLQHRLFVTGLNEHIRPSPEMWVGEAGWQNLGLRGDINGDGIISPHDALLIINELSFNQYRDAETGELPAGLTEPVPPHERTPLFDATGDGIVSPHDALFVINLLGLDPEEEGT